MASKQIAGYKRGKDGRRKFLQLVNNNGNAVPKHIYETKGYDCGLHLAYGLANSAVTRECPVVRVTELKALVQALKAALVATGISFTLPSYSIPIPVGNSVADDPIINIDFSFPPQTVRDD